MIFYSNFDIKRLYVSKHILIDGTYVFPKGFTQTIIFLYYDYLTFKFIPAIFILINNKTQIGYQHAFQDIKEYFLNYKNNTKENLQWETFTIDFERAIINAFNLFFNNTNNELLIKHICCYFHFLKNGSQKLQNEGYTAQKFNTEYNLLMDFLSQLPFQYNIHKMLRKK